MRRKLPAVPKKATKWLAASAAVRLPSSVLLSTRPPINAEAKKSEPSADEYENPHPKLVGLLGASPLFALCGSDSEQ